MVSNPIEKVRRLGEKEAARRVEKPIRFGVPTPRQCHRRTALRGDSRLKWELLDPRCGTCVELTSASVRPNRERRIRLCRPLRFGNRSIDAPRRARAVAGIAGKHRSWSDSGFASFRGNPELERTFVTGCCICTSSSNNEIARDPVCWQLVDSYAYKP